MYDVVLEDNWDETSLLDILPEELPLHIIENIKPPLLHDELDRPYWSLETRDNFIVKTAYEYVRRKRDPNTVYINI